MLHFHADRETYRHLGPLILATVFHPEPAQVRVQLTHPATQVMTLPISCTHPTWARALEGYQTQPYAFEYQPGEMQRFPWGDLRLDLDDLPRLCLASSRYFGDIEEDWRRRDVAEGFGGDVGSVLFAELLLNASRPENPVTEYHLEGDAGVRCVGPMSAEIGLNLPGSPAWDPSEWAADG